MCFLTWGKEVQQSLLSNGDLRPGSTPWPKFIPCGRMTHAQPRRTLTPELPGFPFEPVREAKISMGVFRQQGFLTRTSPLKTGVILNTRQYAWKIYSSLVTTNVLNIQCIMPVVETVPLLSWNQLGIGHPIGPPTTTTEQKDPMYGQFQVK